MNDLISKKIAIEKIEKHEIERPGYNLNDYEYGWNQALICVEDIIEDLPSAEPKAEEIAVTLCKCPNCGNLNFVSTYCPDCGHKYERSE